MSAATHIWFQPMSANVSPKPPDTQKNIAGTYPELARPEKLGVVLSPPQNLTQFDQYISLSTEILISCFTP